MACLLAAHAVGSTRWGDVPNGDFAVDDPIRNRGVEIGKMLCLAVLVERRAVVVRFVQHHAIRPLGHGAHVKLHAPRLLFERVFGLLQNSFVKLADEFTFDSKHNVNGALGSRHAKSLRWRNASTPACTAS